MSNTSVMQLKRARSNDAPAKPSEGTGYPRVTVRLTGNMKAAVDEIIQNTSAQNPSDAVRRAVAVYHTLIEERIAGNEPYIEIRESHGTRKLPIFL